MIDDPKTLDRDLSDLEWSDWIDGMHDMAGSDGYAEALGERHAAVFIESKPILLVSFEEFDTLKARSGKAHPLGWEMIKALGWSQLCLVSQGPSWFRDPRVFGFFDRLIDDGLFEEFEQVIFYGAGACGYAAAAFSVAAPGAKVLALQPQATLDPRITEWDERFREMRRVDFSDRFGYAPDMLDAAREAYVVYDPQEDLDAMHAALFTRSNVTKVRVRFLGAQLETCLVRMKVLYRMLAQISAGKLGEVNRARLLRAKRGDGAFQFNLLRHLQAKGRHRLVEILCRQVLEQRNAPLYRKALLKAQQALAEAGETPAET